MVRVRPSDLPELSTITPSDSIILDNGSVVGRVTADQIFDYVSANLDFRADSLTEDHDKLLSITAQLLYTSSFAYDEGALGAKLQNDAISVKDAPYLAKGDGLTDDYNAIKAAWDDALAAGKDLFFPDGTYVVKDKNFPFRQEGGTTLLDAGNITVFGNGPTTVLKTVSSEGADVLQLNNLKNFHVRNLSITSEITTTMGYGSNGISVTGGYDNITIDQVWVENLAYIDKGTHLDGGKGLSIQPGTPAAECGTLTARVFAKGCVYGFGLEIDLVNWAAKKHAIDVQLVAEDCYVGAIVSAGAASSALSAGMNSGLTVTGSAVNCQIPLILSRAHGVNVDLNVVTTKTEAARRLDPEGSPWDVSEPLVAGMVCTYAKDSRISITGDVGACENKVRLGAASAGASGLNGATENCDIFINLAGTASGTAVLPVGAGGNLVNDCTLTITSLTTADVPTAFYEPVLNNTIINGPAQRLMGVSLVGALRFAYTDGKTSYTSIERDTFGAFVRQIGGTSNDIAVLGVKNHLGDKKFTVRNDGALGTAARQTASSVSTVKAALPVYDEAGTTFIGYVPVYTSAS